MTDIAKREKALAEVAREANAALSTVTAPPQDQPDPPALAAARWAFTGG